MRKLLSVVLLASGASLIALQAGRAQTTTAPPAQAQAAPPALEQPALDKAGILAADLATPRPDDAPAPALIKAQILLDRAHASPGVIDGRAGDNMNKAIAAFETERGLATDGKLDTIWSALQEGGGAPVVMDYTITPADLAGPFEPDLPGDYAKLAKLKSAAFRTPLEMFGERFHMDERLLKALNPGADFGKAGASVLVADVATQPLTAKLARLVVDKDAGQVRAYDAQDKLVVAYSATVGSDDLPSPSGDHKVRGVAWHPVYSYDPKKNFQQGKNTKKLTLPSGPNNPVGTVFIALSKPTYGIHGSPDPAKIDKGASHGCVRLTNWNAEELAHMMRNGLPVHFQ